MAELKQRRLMRAAVAGLLALAIGLTLFFGLRLVGSTLYWASHKDAPIEAWMTVGMVSRAYGVPRGMLMAAAGLPPDARDRRPLSEIAADEGIAYAELLARLEAAIATERAAIGGPDAEPHP